MDDDYLSYFEDFEQESGSKHSDSYHSVNIEQDTIIKEPKVVKKVKKTKKPAMAGLSSPRDRLLSSKDHELRALQNLLSATRKELKDTERENKTLRRIQIRQDKELTKLSSKEGELPMILDRHSREVRSLREQLKKTQKANKELSKKQSDLSEELWRANERKKDLEKLSKRKDLKEREHLMMELQDSVEESKKKSQRILELEKRVELVNKTHTQEMKSLMAKNKLLASQLANTEQEMIRFRHQMKEKERLLEVTNIYSQRVPHSSLLPPPLPVTEDTSTQTTLTQPLRDANKEMILKVKRETRTAECQTEGMAAAISVNKFSTKQQALSKSFSDEGTSTSEVRSKQPPPVAKTTATPVAMTTTTSKPVAMTTVQAAVLSGGKDDGQVRVEVPVSTVQATQTPEPLKLPTRPSLRRPPQTDEKPLMDLSLSPPTTPTVSTGATPTTEPPAGPMSKPMPTISPLAKAQATPTSVKTGVQQSPEKTSNIHQILFGTSTGTSTPTQQQPPAANQNDSAKAQMDRKQKDELMKKLFPQKYNTETPKEETKEHTDDEDEESNGGRRRRRSDTTSRKATEIFGTSSITDDDDIESVVKPKPTRVNGVVMGHRANTRIGSAVGGRKVNSNSNNNSNLLNQLFNTNDPPKRESDTEKKQVEEKVAIINDSSSTSLLSQSERVKNMHKGLPSMASGDDLYGTKQRSTSGDNAGGTVKHGRRAAPTTVKASSSSNGMIFGEQSLSNAVFGDSSNTIFGNGRSSSMDERSKAGGGTYPWETQVNIHSNSGTGTTGGNHRVNNSNSRVFDDEIDEITI